jgi:DNA-binding transcriptional LysR family regulator
VADKRRTDQSRRAGKRAFYLYHRDGFPALFDSIIKLCHEHGFSPNVEEESDMMQAVLSLVAAEQGILIVPPCVFNVGYDGVQQLRRIQPDDVQADLLIAWPRARPSPVLQTFLALVEATKTKTAGKSHADYSRVPL